MTLRKLAGDTLIYGTGYILGRVLSYLLITVYLTWKFDEEEVQYGLYTDFYFYVALVLVILTLRMETTFFRFGSKKEDYGAVYSQASLMLVCTASAWLIFLFLCRDSIAQFLQYPGYEKHVMVLGSILALDVLVAIPFASLRLEQRPVRFALLKLSGITINILAVLFFLELLPRMALEPDSWADRFYNHDDRLLYVFVGNLIASLFVFAMFLPRYLRIRLDRSRLFFGRMLRYTWPLVIVGIAGVINQSSYITFQKFILPNTLAENLAEGGVYAAATRIAILMSLFITAFNYAAEPFFFRHATEENARQTYADVARAFAVVGSIMMVGIVLYLDVIQLILGESYRASIHYVPILLTAFFLLGLYYNFSVWYKLTDRTIYGAIISAFGAVLTVTINLVLIPVIGVGGSAVAAVSCYGFMAIACYVLGRRYYPIPYRVGHIALLAATGMVFYWISELFRAWMDPSVAVMIGFNTVLFAVFIAGAYRFEQDVFKALLRRGQQ